MRKYTIKRLRTSKSKTSLRFRRNGPVSSLSSLHDPQIVSANSEVSDKPARTHMLILVFTARLYPMELCLVVGFKDILFALILSATEKLAVRPKES